MKFLVDIGVGKPVDDYLTNSGHDVKTVRKIQANMSDDAISNLAAAEERIVITMDKDFGDLVFRSGSKHSGVLLLRTENLDGEEKAEILKFILENHAEVIQGNFCVFQKGKLRIHG